MSLWLHEWPSFYSTIKTLSAILFSCLGLSFDKVTCCHFSGYYQLFCSRSRNRGRHSKFFGIGIPSQSNNGLSKSSFSGRVKRTHPKYVWQLGAWLIISFCIQEMLCEKLHRRTIYIITDACGNCNNFGKYLAKRVTKSLIQILVCNISSRGFLVLRRAKKKAHFSFCV